MASAAQAQPSSLATGAQLLQAGSLQQKPSTPGRGNVFLWEDEFTACALTEVQNPSKLQIPH